LGGEATVSAISIFDLDQSNHRIVVAGGDVQGMGVRNFHAFLVTLPPLTLQVDRDREKGRRGKTKSFE